MLTGQERRDTLRAAIKTARGWHSYRNTFSCDLSSMTMPELETAFIAMAKDAGNEGFTPEMWAEHKGFPGNADHEAERIYGNPPVVAPTPTPTPTPVSTPSQHQSDVALAEVIAEAIIRSRGSAGLQEKDVIELIKTHGGDTVAALSTRLDDIAAKVADLQLPTRVEIVNNGVATPVQGLSHYLLPQLLTLLSAKQSDGIAPNIWIAGPTGSGKTHACAQVAKALGIPFFFNGALADKFELVGHYLPKLSGDDGFVVTAFRQAFEHGGLYAADECDAWDNSALLSLNAALSNGVMVFGDSPVPIKRHPDFVCVACANTFGQGGTADYVGRNKIDAAFLARFPVQLFWDYDLALEQAMSGNIAWAKRVQRARDKAAQAGVKIIINPRHSMAGAALLANGMAEDEVARLTYLASLSADHRRMIEG